MPAKTDFNKDYIKATKRARMAAGLSQEEAARKLGVPLETYKKYETRSTLPPRLLGQFSVITRAPLNHLLAGGISGHYDDLPPLVQQVVDICMTTPPEGRKQILDFVKMARAMAFTGDEERRNEAQQVMVRATGRAKDKAKTHKP